jgi:hypothetical protein
MAADESLSGPTWASERFAFGLAGQRFETLVGHHCSGSPAAISRVSITFASTAPSLGAQVGTMVNQT